MSQKFKTKAGAYIEIDSTYVTFLDENGRSKSNIRFSDIIGAEASWGKLTINDRYHKYSVEFASSYDAEQAFKEINRHIKVEYNYDIDDRYLYIFDKRNNKYSADTIKIRIDTIVSAESGWNHELKIKTTDTYPSIKTYILSSSINLSRTVRDINERLIIDYKIEKSFGNSLKLYNPNNRDDSKSFKIDSIKDISLRKNILTIKTTGYPTSHTFEFKTNRAAETVCIELKKLIRKKLCYKIYEGALILYREGDNYLNNSIPRIPIDTITFARRIGNVFQFETSLLRGETFTYEFDSDSEAIDISSDVQAAINRLHKQSRIEIEQINKLESDNDARSGYLFQENEEDNSFSYRAYNTSNADKPKKKGLSAIFHKLILGSYEDDGTEDFNYSWSEEHNSKLSGSYSTTNNNAFHIESPNPFNNPPRNEAQFRAHFLCKSWSQNVYQYYYYAEELLKFEHLRSLDEYHDKLINQGYLERACLGRSLYHLSGEQLDTMLADLNLKKGGTKAEKALKILNGVSSEDAYAMLPQEIYALTVKGIDAIRSQTAFLKLQPWLDVEKAISEQENTMPVFAVREKYSDEEKVKVATKAVKQLYSAMKGPGVRDYISDVKDIAKTKEDLEKKLLSMPAKKFYTPDNYTDIKKVISNLGDYKLDNIIEDVYTSQTRYMIVDKEEFKELICNISAYKKADYYAFIEDKWINYVNKYMDKQK